jgi:PAS domain S-box-containing protein
MKTDFDTIILNETPDAVIITTPEGKVAHWSRGAESAFGYTSAEALGRSLDELIIPPDRLGEERRVLRETPQVGGNNYESLRRRKDGSLIYVDVSRKAVRDAKGKLEFILFTKKDVTQLKALRDAKWVEAKFRDLLESTPDAIVMANQTGCIVLANTRAETMFGYKSGKLRGQLVEALLPRVFAATTWGSARIILSSRVRAPWERGRNCTACARTAANSRWKSA